MQTSEKTAELQKAIKTHKGKIFIEIGTSMIYCEVSKAKITEAISQSRLLPKCIRLEKGFGSALIIEHDYSAFEDARQKADAISRSCL